MPAQPRERAWPVPRQQHEQGRGQGQRRRQGQRQPQRHARAGARKELEPGRPHQREPGDHRGGTGQQGPGRAPQGRLHRRLGVRGAEVLAEPPRQEQAEVGPTAEQHDHEEELDQRRHLPARQREPGQHTPRHHQADADGGQRHQGDQERPVNDQQHHQQQRDGRHRRAVERLLHVVHVVAADDRVARPEHLEPRRTLAIERGGLGLEPGDGPVRRRADERAGQGEDHELHLPIVAHQPPGHLRRRLRTQHAEHVRRPAGVLVHRRPGAGRIPRPPASAPPAASRRPRPSIDTTARARPARRSRSPGRSRRPSAASSPVPRPPVASSSARASANARRQQQPGDDHRDRLPAHDLTEVQESHHPCSPWLTETGSDRARPGSGPKRSGKSRETNLPDPPSPALRQALASANGIPARIVMIRPFRFPGTSSFFFFFRLQDIHSRSEQGAGCKSVTPLARSGRSGIMRGRVRHQSRRSP